MPKGIWLQLRCSWKKMASGGHLLIWLSTVRSLRYREGDVSLREAYAREKRENNKEKKWILKIRVCLAYFLSTNWLANVQKHNSYCTCIMNAKWLKLLQLKQLYSCVTKCNTFCYYYNDSLVSFSSLSFTLCVLLCTRPCKDPILLSIGDQLDDVKEVDDG